MRKLGTVARGIRMPIFYEGDDLLHTISQELDAAIETEGIEVRDKDVIGITESIVARAQGNYVTIGNIAEDVRNKMGSGPIGLVFPILSRNRFMSLLEGISKGVDKLIIQLSFPADEVGNQLMTVEYLRTYGRDLENYAYTEDDFKEIFGNNFSHPFTGIDYVKLYKSINSNISIIFANDPKAILRFTKKVICGDIHTRKLTYDDLKESCEKIITLADIMNAPIGDSGYNKDYGLLGSNYSGNGRVKLFPRDSQYLVDGMQAYFQNKYHKIVEVLVYGDGAFKDPIGKIWELADPVVSPFFTKGLLGTPAELKLKLIADTQDINSADDMRKYISEHKPLGEKQLGTTPRQLTDLLGSLCDLTSGSGDKGTPVIYIQGYFDTYADE